jgi:hypothetical protein
MPTFQQLCLVYFNQFLDAVNLGATEAPIALQADGLKPEFGGVIITLNVDMGWLVTIASIAEKPIGASSEQCWHAEKLI